MPDVDDQERAPVAVLEELGIHGVGVKSAHRASGQTLSANRKQEVPGLDPRVVAGGIQTQVLVCFEVLGECCEVRRDDRQVLVELAVVGEYGNSGRCESLGLVALVHGGDESLAGIRRLHVDHTHGLEIRGCRGPLGEVPDGDEFRIRHRNGCETVRGLGRSEECGPAFVVEAVQVIERHVRCDG